VHPPVPETPPRTARSPRWLIATLLAIGVALRVWQYLGDTSLWFDELSIARNIHERTFAQLMTQPLGYNQIAPVGFLAMVKGSALLLGPSDMALRLFPFLCGLLSLILFWRVAARALDPVATPVALGIFVIGLPFIRYTSELKQYGADLDAALALTLIALDLRSSPPTVRQCALAGLAALPMVLFSQAAIVVMVGLGAVLVGLRLLERSPDTRLPALITAPIWVASALVGLWVARQHTTPETIAYMHQFWGQRLGFFPLPPRHARDALWLWDRIGQLFAEEAMLKYPVPWLYEAIAMLGLIVLWRRARDIALIVVTPLAAAAAAAIAQQYPFRLRVVLFVVPTLVLLVATGVRWISAQAARLHPLSGSAMLAGLVASPVYAIVADRPAYSVENYKDVLAHVQSHRRPDDPVYVYANTYEAMEHYGARYGFAPDGYILGTCDERESRRYLEDVDRFRGLPRVWFVASSVRPFYPARQSIDRYLHAIGVVLDSIAVPSQQRGLFPVSAELFDLSDSMRLQAATAASFPVTPIDDTLPPPCNDWVRPTSHAPRPARGPDTVVVRSGALELRALLWHPKGSGPFPAVLFNHGSGHATGADASGRRDQRHPELLGPVFARHGYGFLYLFRRGDGLSAGHGVPSGDRMDSAFAARGQSGRNHLQLRLLETDELSDALAGLAFLRALPDVDPRRVAVAGVSFGGSLTLLVAEHDSTLRAAVAFATAGYSWERSPELRERLLAAVGRIAAPVFFIHAANDYSVAPGKALAAEMTRLGKPHLVTIYPPVGRTADEGHDFVDLRVATWEPDVFAFLDSSMRP
jgi:dienelactone hydrolase